MRVFVLGSPRSWYVSDLLRAAAGRHELTPLAFEQLQAGVSAAVPPWDGPDPAAVLVRSMPAGSLEQVVLRMDILGELSRRGVTVVNRPRALEIAIDKYLATARLSAAGLPVPRTVACQGVDQALQAFDQLGGDVVVKPLFGSEGRGLIRVADADLAWRVFKALEQSQQVIYLQEFVPHQGFDYRVLMVGERMWAMRRVHDQDWRTNISRGGRAEFAQLDDELRDLACRSAAAVGADLAGVDILQDAAGQRLVLEVNAVPGWRALARLWDVDIAREVLDYLAALRAHPLSSVGDG